MLSPARKWSLLAVTAFLALSSCTKLKDVEVVNPCGDQITVNLWETPTPAAAAKDTPTRVVVGPRSTAVAKDALADVGNDGSGAEIVAGPGTGQVLTIPHGGKLVVSIPTTLC
jgi:hypothetical protein